MPRRNPEYPPDWTRIAYEARERASHRCQSCRVLDGSDIMRIMVLLAGADVASPAYVLLDGRTYSSENGDYLGEDIPHVSNTPPVSVRVWLQVAHLNHNTFDNRPANLAAFCQRCHNVYDAFSRQKKRVKKKTITSTLQTILEGIK